MATSVPGERVPEVVLARIWNDGWHSKELRSTSGRRVNVVYRGVWTHSDGPDFRDAMLEIDGRLLTGSVELHIRSSDWNAHSHHTNPAYDQVVAHIVLEDDLPEPCHGPSGKHIETVVIAPFLSGPIEDFMSGVVPVDLGSLGQQACLPTLAGGHADEIHAVLRREGWRRLSDKQLRFQQAMQVHPPAEVLYRGMLDSLGLTANRAGMEAVADRLPLAVLERIMAQAGPVGGLAALLGAGGFLPLSPAHAGLLEADVPVDRVEVLWDELARWISIAPVEASTWTLNRVRPLNHPVRRLASMASILASCGDGGLLRALLDCSDGACWDRWLAQASPAIGNSRRQQMIVNTLAPFFAAFAEVSGNDDLQNRIAPLWDGLAGGVDDSVARQTLRQITGGKRFRVSSAVEVQGLHQIGRNGCAHLRCFECPIAVLAVLHEEQVPSV